MSKRSFGNQFFLTLAIVFVPMFAAFRYLESTNAIDSFGFWNTVVTALVLSIIPAILICMAWRHLRR